jgi:hypothetical protein
MRACKQSAIKTIAQKTISARAGGRFVGETCLWQVGFALGVLGTQGTQGTQGTKTFVDSFGLDLLNLGWRLHDTRLSRSSPVLTNLSTGQQVHIEDFGLSDPAASCSIELLICHRERRAATGGAKRY